MTVSQPTFKGQNEREVYFESSLFINNMKKFDLVANLNRLGLSQKIFKNSNRQEMRNGHPAVKLSFELT